MKTTIDIADPLLVEAKKVAASRKTTLKALIEEGLRHVLGRARTEPFKLRDGSFKGGTGLTPEMEAKGGWAKLREAAYPGFFDDDDDDEEDLEK